MMSHHRGLSPGGTILAACLALGTSVAAIAEHSTIPERRLRASVRRCRRRREWVEPDPVGPWVHDLAALLSLLSAARAYQDGQGAAEDVAGAAAAVVGVGWGLGAAGRLVRAVRAAVGKAMRAQ